MIYTPFKRLPVLGISQFRKTLLTSLLATSVLVAGMSVANAQEDPFADAFANEASDSSDPFASEATEEQGDAFSFDDNLGSAEKSTNEIENEFRKKAFEQAMRQLMPLKPDEIRTLLENYDRTVESTVLPVYPNPRPELVVKNISLDPGVLPQTLKLAQGYVTTLSFLDSSGTPWPIDEISWVGQFKIQESGVATENHMLRISPETELAHGNVSIRLRSLDAPVIMTFETGRDTVHYRFDAVIPKKLPGGRAPLIDRGISLTAGDVDMSVALSGVVPEGSEALDVSGVDGRTTAYVYNGLTYIRTPLNLLSPAWHSSVSSIDGTKVYALDETPVVLLSDNGRMIRAHLTQREGL